MTKAAQTVTRKFIVTDLTDDAACCKPYRIWPESFMRPGIVAVTAKEVGISVVFLFAQTGFPALGQSPKIILPTENQALLTGDNAAFYQYVKRDFEGEAGKVWEGGQYGFVRDPRRFGTTVLYTRFHEGIDIQPLQRGPNGEPLDVIHAIAPGKVVYTNTVPSHSNYGRYIVIEHQLDGCPYYSLYAHLNTVGIQPGDQVAQGDPIGVMGHTGVGIDRERAHLHLELNLLLNADFEQWSAKYFPTDPNRHGIYNGQNLDGFDIGRFYLELKKNPRLTVPAFFQMETTWYRAWLPASKRMDILRRYPWLSGGQTEAKSWEVSFNQAGLPIHFETSEKVVEKPVLSWVKPSPYPYALQTRGYIQGIGSTYYFSKEGERYLDLISPAQ
jgi:murein DD-endopeptidase MepM/ murein hydrolase activator NlpD